jgi:hypothetical protein
MLVKFGALHPSFHAHGDNILAAILGSFKVFFACVYVMLRACCVLVVCSIQILSTPLAGSC